MCVFFEFGLGYRMKYLLLVKCIWVLQRRSANDVRRKEQRDGIIRELFRKVFKCIHWKGISNLFLFFVNDILFEIYDGWICGGDSGWPSVARGGEGNVIQILNKRQIPFALVEWATTKRNPGTINRRPSLLPKQLVPPLLKSNRIQSRINKLSCNTNTHSQIWRKEGATKLTIKYINSMSSLWKWIITLCADSGLEHSDCDTFKTECSCIAIAMRPDSLRHGPAEIQTQTHTAATHFDKDGTDTAKQPPKAADALR